MWLERQDGTIWNLSQAQVISIDLENFRIIGYFSNEEIVLHTETEPELLKAMYESLKEFMAIDKTGVLASDYLEQVAERMISKNGQP